MNEPLPLYTLNVPDVVELEQMIAADGTPLYELMVNAGAALASAAGERLGRRGAVVVLAGSGNNGGDGWVAAESLARSGHDAVVVTPRAPEELTTEPARTAALHAVDTCPDLPVLVNPGRDELKGRLAAADVAIDAMLGTGFSHDVLRAPYADWTCELDDAHAAGLHVIAADIPSGVSAQTGACSKPHVVADQTITMMTRKPGMPPEHCGAVRVAEIHDLAPYEAFLEQRAVR